MKTYIDDIIKPKLQGDGGEISFISQQGGTVTVEVRGECSKCMILDRCIDWIETQAEKDTGQKVKIRAVRRKPYFWDT